MMLLPTAPPKEYSGGGNRTKNKQMPETSILNQAVLCFPLAACGIVMSLLC